MKYDSVYKNFTRDDIFLESNMCKLASLKEIIASKLPTDEFINANLLKFNESQRAHYLASKEIHRQLNIDWLTKNKFVTLTN